MATDAIQLINQQGIIQLDGSERTLRRVASGTGSASSWTGTPNEAAIPTQTYTPIIFFRPADDTVFVTNSGILNNKFMYVSNGAFEWTAYGLDNPAAIDATPYGAQVFDSLGRVIWDSRQDVMRITQVLQVNMPFPDNDSGNGTGPAPAYPYTLSFTPWGTRPWILLNSLLRFLDDNDTMIAASTLGTDRIVLQCGRRAYTGVAWDWASNNGGGIGYTRSYPGGRMTIPIGRRDT
ncbi:hypothetical protein [Rhizobacter sp. Root1221]|uniref:hypothetical protein n=1 Tax=Rhizobacter sp. Root1221 TaxID=1736433 RepID=UPI0006FB79B2|nr:hypothetical protein [Rhizobacter sp. Root1221]KQV99962.1 hypothetical protein ASC87_19875 [Rhizobacter sp. Root1221]